MGVGSKIWVLSVLLESRTAVVWICLSMTIDVI